MDQMVPWQSDAIVTSIDGSRYRVFVALKGGLGCQITALPVEVALQGHNDGVRGHWPPLPAVGTHGRVSFTAGDIRNGRWEGAHRSNLTDSCSHTAADPNLDYTAHFDGGFSWRGGDGTVAERWADGTAWLLGAAMPAPTRHTLAADQGRQTVPYTAQEARPSPLAPQPLTFTHSTGVKVSISASGAVAVSGLSSQPVAFYGPGVALVMDGGAVAVSGALSTTGNIAAGTGATGTVPTGTGYSLTIENGIITNITPP